MKTVFPRPVCPHIVAEWAVCGKRLISRCDEPAIFNIELRIHDDKQIDVQSASRLCLLRDLDRNAFAGIFNAATAAMKAVIIACPEVKPQGVLAGQELSKLTSARARSFATVPTSG